MRIPLVLLLFLGYSGIGLSQQAYFRLDGGYSLPAGPYKIGENQWQSYSSEIVTGVGSTLGPPPVEYTLQESKQENVYGSFFDGIQAGAAAGYMLNQFFGMEIKGSYHWSRTYRISYFNNGEPNSAGNFERQFTSTGVSLMPSLLVSPGVFGKISPYLRTGVVVSFPKIIENYSDREEISPRKVYREIYAGRPAVGYSAGMGLNLKLGNTIAFMGEFSFTAATFRPAYSKITEYLVNGETKTEFRIKTNYVRDKVVQPSIPLNERGGEKLAISFPYGNIGIRFGVQYHLPGSSR